MMIELVSNQVGSRGKHGGGEEKVAGQTMHSLNLPMPPLRGSPVVVRGHVPGACAAWLSNATAPPLNTLRSIVQAIRHSIQLVFGQCVNRCRCTFSRHHDH
jgi:hypothetical protein